ncbi:WD repeat-containing protein [Reticulomyxa filosa]|uniref:WD repeat-containing protein n=1 Tax=Reticulomyxa filosa TaxID=46433 RepID=X6LXP9_RETFI|nr:WD repeat-containing protein [Reticulomyxa filosa]|eukprot:ETO06151.1 WD repeat-containing protein [Reticulomyxa filosa]
MFIDSFRFVKLRHLTTSFQTKSMYFAIFFSNGCAPDANITLITQLNVFYGHTDVVVELNFHHLIMVDIYVLDHVTKQFVYGILKHPNNYISIGMSPMQSNNDNNGNKSNSIGVIGGNGYTIWAVCSVKYGSNELLNTILSGSEDTSVRLWDIRSGKQIQIFNGHTDIIDAVEYSPFVINNIDICGNSNVICSGSQDNTICFWDIRSNKNELYMIKEKENEDDRITRLKFLPLKKKKRKIKMKKMSIMILNCVMVHTKVQFIFGDNIHFLTRNVQLKRH